MTWTGNEKCKHCGEPHCYTHCSETEDGNHVADWKTVALADGEAISSDGTVCFDVWCKECGQSGSFTIDAKKEEVAWA